MKRLVYFMGGVLAIIAVLGVFSVKLSADSGTSSLTNQLTIYNWGDYIDEELLKKFEKETGYKVSYVTFDSNEAMYTKVKQGGTTYDIAIPSEYMIDKMISENLLVKLDKSKIKGLANIDSRFLDLDFDAENNYSIPYFWGTVGIVYNDKFVKNAPEHWNDLWSETYRNNLMLIDGAREIIGMALNAENNSLNSTDMGQLNLAYKHLKLLSPNVKAIVADEIKQYMINNEAAAAVTFSGEAAEMVDENEHLHYIVPSEGSNLWFDNIVIPKTAKNYEAAYAFINFMLDPENAAQNAEYVGYATPNRKAESLLPDEIKNDKQFYPDEAVIAHLEVYKNLGPEYLGIYNDLFLQFKMYRK
ncbi:spermidine/putrescine ABC transporter substrate-binding protein [Lactococcus hodotermopsidis]|uniref:Spermidine/putrescine ABC transporter substrate-binding protein n=1 Tax=Pseudolactococcus hodotermopsidis TaxID=2709157 RepID=A0A6A0BAE9_9LACT|nr:ABC transporter substrate-binding protein [Lactococcus hodotermopsidis]GFH41766.1 spermidine/putrescine ABC transporter substrate-binding protein [Lactococcus hodotermopsidis]